MRHYRIRRYRRQRLTDRQIAAAVAGGAVIALAAHHGGGTAGATTAVAAHAIAYASAQFGKPYLWGGTGPDAFDCSGLAQMADQAAGISIARTSQAQWATEAHVSSPQPGDLVFFAGADGTPSSPGHVGIVTDPATDTMIDAYASGFPVEADTYGPGASKPGLSDPVGFTQPWGGA